MMDVVPGKKPGILNTEKLGNDLLFRAESGTLRLSLLANDAVRVSYTDGTCFPEGQGAFLRGEISLQGVEGWTLSEEADRYVYQSPRVHIEVSKRNGALTFLRPDGRLFLRENARAPRSVEPFEAFRTAADGEVKTERVETADGVKFRIVDAQKESAGNWYHTRVDLCFSGKECLTGLGQSEEGAAELRHTTQYLHPANRKIAIPFFLSSFGYGLLFTTESTAIFSDSDQYGTYFRTEADRYLDYIFLPGGHPDGTIRMYRELSGHASMLPRWCFGYVQSQERYIDAKELLETAEEFERRRLPLDCLVMDWMSWPDGMWGQKSFDPERFPDPKAMTDALHEKGVRFMISVWPNMTAQCENHKEMKAAGQILPGTEIYNAYSEEGREIYDRQLSALRAGGVDAWWCDSSEPLTPEWGKKARPEASAMYHEYAAEAEKTLATEKGNAFGYYHALGMYEGFRRADDKRRVVNLTRSGSTGSQALGTILWSGDTSASWKTFGEQVRAGIQFCASGHPWWTLDIGAFFVKYGLPWFWDGDYPEGIDSPGYKELYTRWFEYGAFLPVFRAHGTDIRREPWAFGEEGSVYYEALKRSMELRYRLLPYIYSCAAEASLKDKTLMRPLAFDFPENGRAWEIHDQFMFGPALMVCPITSPMEADPEAGGTSSRTVYFPAESDWYDFETGERIPGGAVKTVCSGIDRIPVYVRAGAVIPTQKPGLHTDDQTGEAIEILVYAGANGRFTLYEDAGDGYDYIRGKCCETLLTWDDRKGTLDAVTVGDESFRRGAFITRVVE